MSPIPKIVISLAKKGREILLNCENAIIFGSILNSQFPNDIDVIVTYQISNINQLSKEIEAYSTIAFNLVGVSLHITLLTIEEAKESSFYKMIINNHCYFIK